jgi:SAM-dependent methyltransferase/DNA-binding MarR family transcriptional regulator
MNGVELYLLGRRLMNIGGDALPPDSWLRRISPSGRLLLTDLIDHTGTSAAATAERTGLPLGYVSAELARLSADGLVETRDDPADPGRSVALPALGEFQREAGDTVNGALAAALGMAEPGEADEIVGTLEALAGRLAERTAARGPADFNAMYSGTPPWDIGRPQRAFTELADDGAIRGRVLDVGCGTGEHALMAAALGLQTVGVDAAPAAIEIAERKARERGLPARFLVHDALRLSEMGEQFDTVIDSGLFHVFDDEDRATYVDSLRSVVPPGGRYFMLCFSDRQPPGYGPRRIAPDEIRGSFADGWRVDAIDAVTLEVTRDPEGVRAWRSAITRT